MEGEPDIVIELIDLYVEDVPRRFEIMRSAISDGDRSAVQRQAHTVKGSSGNLGALGIAQICDRMERLEFDGPDSNLQALMDQLEQEFSDVRIMLHEERQRRLG
jgi:HPt (histidine-containing phosphotransfer) domain-containing protein